MRPADVLAVGLSALLIGTGALTAVRSSISGDAGQVVFIPGASAHLVAAPPAEDLVIHSCEQEPDGLRVAGWVEPSTSPIEIRVSGGDDADRGVRVGAAYAADGGSLPGARVGDFLVLLPWAKESSRFIRVQRGGDGDRIVKGAAYCPHQPVEQGQP